MPPSASSPPQFNPLRAPEMSSELDFGEPKPKTEGGVAGPSTRRGWHRFVAGALSPRATGKRAMDFEEAILEVRPPRAGFRRRWYEPIRSVSFPRRGAGDNLGRRGLLRRRRYDVGEPRRRPDAQLSDG